MPRVQVFDPAMCCSTGVCGPSVDPALIRFSGDIEWLKGQGIAVERNNLSQQPQAFVSNTLVRDTLQARGVDVLPLVLIDGQIAFEAAYPLRADLAAKLGLKVEGNPSLMTEAVAELVALGAAVAANCETCFRAHYDRARKLGVTKEDMWLAVQTAQAVIDQQGGRMAELATRYLLPKQDDELRIIQPGNCC